MTRMREHDLIDLQEPRDKWTLAMLRKESQLSQAELAERLGVSQSWVSRLEAARDPGLRSVQTYGAALGFDVRIYMCMIEGRSSMELDLLAWVKRNYAWIAPRRRKRR